MRRTVGCVTLCLVLTACTTREPVPTANPSDSSVSAAVRCPPNLESSCFAIARAFALQIGTDVTELRIEDSLHCDTLVLGPACDRPGLRHVAGVLAIRTDGSEAYFNAWRDASGGILLYDNQPRFNATE